MLIRLCLCNTVPGLQIPKLNVIADIPMRQSGPWICLNKRIVRIPAFETVLYDVIA